MLCIRWSFSPKLVKNSTMTTKYTNNAITTAHYPSAQLNDYVKCEIRWMDSKYAITPCQCNHERVVLNSIQCQFHARHWNWLPLHCMQLSNPHNVNSIVHLSLHERMHCAWNVLTHRSAHIRSFVSKCSCNCCSNIFAYRTWAIQTICDATNIRAIPPENIRSTSTFFFNVLWPSGSCDAYKFRRIPFDYINNLHRTQFKSVQLSRLSDRHI